MEPQILAIWAQIGISGMGLTGIFWGLFQMQKAGRRRDREIDMISRALERQGATMGQALERQGEVLSQAAQALERQGQVLAELLRRSA